MGAACSWLGAARHGRVRGQAHGQGQRLPGETPPPPTPSWKTCIQPPLPTAAAPASMAGWCSPSPRTIGIVLPDWKNCLQKVVGWSVFQLGWLGGGVVGRAEASWCSPSPPTASIFLPEELPAGCVWEEESACWMVGRLGGWFRPQAPLCLTCSCLVLIAFKFRKTVLEVFLKFV